MQYYTQGSFILLGHAHGTHTHTHAHIHTDTHMGTQHNLSHFCSFLCMHTPYHHSQTQKLVGHSHCPIEAPGVSRPPACHETYPNTSQAGSVEARVSRASRSAHHGGPKPGLPHRLPAWEARSTKQPATRRSQSQGWTGRARGQKTGGGNRGRSSLSRFVLQPHWDHEQTREVVGPFLPRRCQRK